MLFAQKVGAGGTAIAQDIAPEFLRGIESSWVLGHVRADRETVINEVTAAGFVLDRTHDLLREDYFLEFRKP